jgi:hypothetical protein
LLGDDAGGQLLGDISSEKKPTMPPVRRLRRAVRVITAA